jgi:hypothetical protein
MDFEYEITINRCLNSKWIASFLAKKDQEHCQCGFDCKIEVKYIPSNYKYIISGKEYQELLRDKKIKPWA